MKLNNDNQFIAIMSTFFIIILLGFAVLATIKDLNQARIEADAKYFKSEQLVEFTDWIFMEGYALGLRHRSSAQDSVCVSSKEQEAAELLNYIKKMLDGKPHMQDNKGEQ